MTPHGAKKERGVTLPKMGHDSAWSKEEEGGNSSFWICRHFRLVSCGLRLFCRQIGLVSCGLRLFAGILDLFRVDFMDIWG